MTHGGAWHIGVMAASGIPEMLLTGREHEFLAEYAFPSLNATDGAFAPDDVDEFVRGYARPGGFTGAAGLYRSMLAEGDELRDMASHKLGMPVLAIGGGSGEFTAHTVRQVATDVTAIRLRIELLSGRDGWRVRSIWSQHYLRPVIRHMAVAGLSAALATTGFGCGSQELTAQQRLAYRQATAYWTNPEAVLVRSFDYQQAAAKQFKRNLRKLQGADLGDEGDAALRTLATCKHRVTDGSPTDDFAKCETAFETIRAAVDERLE